MASGREAATSLPERTELDELTTTPAPWAARLSATAAPIPLEDPVTMATLPARGASLTARHPMRSLGWMRRRWLSAAGLALVAGLAGVACGSAAAPPAAAAVTYPSPTAAGEPATPASPAPPDAKAWVVVDADTGAVVASSNDHALMRPASIIKVLTALMAVSDLPPGASVPVGLDAAGTEAAKIDMKAGQVWSLDDTLHSLLIVSANDAAVALADRVGGTEEGFAA